MYQFMHLSIMFEISTKTSHFISFRRMSHNQSQRVLMRMLSNPVELRRQELLHRQETRASRLAAAVVSPLVDYCAGILLL